jgi:hypothetical protein
VQELGRYLSTWLGQTEKFEPQSLRIRGAYDNLDALYGELPRCGDEAINQYFRKHLRPEDAFIVVAQLDWATSYKVVWKTLSERLSPPRELKHAPSAVA